MNTLTCRCCDACGKYAPVFLRVVTGLIFVVHGYQKWSGGVDQFAGFLSTLGFPAAVFFAWVVTLVEIFGGGALVIGFLTHWAAKLLAIDMIVALFVVHADKGFYVSDGGYEFVLLLLASVIFFMSTGPGICSVDESGKKA